MVVNFPSDNYEDLIQFIKKIINHFYLKKVKQCKNMLKQNLMKFKKKVREKPT